MRLQKQIDFIVEIDKLKSIYRKTKLIDDSRDENSSEHSWHLAVIALFFSEYANEKVDISKVIKMVLVHDIVEVDAGDTFCYDEEHKKSKHERERKAAQRIFNLLPEDQAKELFSLWEEFEAWETNESKFAHAIDRFQPLLSNINSPSGGSWNKYKITKKQADGRVGRIKEGSTRLFEEAQKILEEAIGKGWVRKKE